jgi:hypothetical protein
VETQIPSQPNEHLIPVEQSRHLRQELPDRPWHERFGRFALSATGNTSLCAMTHGYKRHGTTDLFAALNVLVRHCVADPQSMKRDGGQA